VDIDEARISDAVVACLTKLPKLRIVRVRGFGETGRDKLQRALPKCHVIGPFDLGPNDGTGDGGGFF
jgi:hypothetical protein